VSLRHRVADWLEYRSLVKHRSRLGRREAPKYTRHWRLCQTVSPRHGLSSRSDLEAAVLRERGCVRTVASPDDPFHPGDPVDDALLSYYGCDYSVFFGKTYRSEHSPQRSGSQLWHADGGPGTCVIVMIYHSSVGVCDGPFTFLRWDRSLDVFRDEPRRASREALCSFYEEIIPWGDMVLGVPGTAILFSNNILHRGGSPDPGHTRLVSLYHCYPSRHRRDANRIIPDKTAAYPVDPDI
jgi:hypothetical protein